MKETFIHVRPARVSNATAQGDNTPEYPSSCAISIAYRLLPEGEDGQWASLGVSFCSPLERYWNRKKGCTIARSRLNNSPVRLRFEALEDKLSARHVRLALDTIIIEEPRWEHVDDQVLRPQRFTQRWGTPLVGPNGSLLTAYFDCLHHSRAPRPSLLESEREPSHWILRIPSWAGRVV